MLSLQGLDEGHLLQRRPEGAAVNARLTGWAGAVPEASVDSGRADVLVLQEGVAKLRLSGFAPGGPYTLRVSGSGQVLTRQFWVGDLWLLAGQSNMEGVGVLADAEEPHPLVRSFSLARVWDQAREPLHVLAESPDEVHHGGLPLSPVQAREFRTRATRGAGVGLPFARRLHAQTGVPQGLICVAHGGTSMSQWSPGQPLYASMMESLAAVNQPIAGVLWYQGCSDTNSEADAAAYTSRTVRLIEAVRKERAQPELPWLVVQIATEVGRTFLPEAWHSVQDQQRRLPEAVPHLDVVAAADLEHDDWIHLSTRAFSTLADRLVCLADRLVYANSLLAPRAKHLEPTDLDEGGLPAPQPLKVRWTPDALSPRLTLDCAHVAGTLTSTGVARGFVLRDAEGRVRDLIYQVRFDGPRVLLRLTDDDLSGVTLHHGLGAQPQINTSDARGLPLPVFGPLPIEGLPPVSPWLRDWLLAPFSPTPVSLFSSRDLADTSDWTHRRIEGWNVVNQHDAWAGQDVTQLGQTTVTLETPRRFQIEAGGDGPLKVWWGTDLVIDDPRDVRDLGTVRRSAVLEAAAGTHRLSIALGNRGGQAYGFFARLRWLEGSL